MAVPVPMADTATGPLYQIGDLCWMIVPPPDVLMVGYGHRSTSDLVRLLDDHINMTHPMVVDIRLHPYSQDRSEWSAESLGALLSGEDGSGSGRYVHERRLGNRNHAAAADVAAKGKPGSVAVEIVDLAGGLQTLRKVIASGLTPVLLCSCGKNPESCHRQVIAAALRAEGLTVRDFDWPDRTKTHGGTAAHMATADAEPASAKVVTVAYALRETTATDGDGADSAEGQTDRTTERQDALTLAF